MEDYLLKKKGSILCSVRQLGYNIDIIEMVEEINAVLFLVW